VQDFGMHRLARAERNLAAIEAYAVPPVFGDRAEIELIRGDIAFYRGDYDGAHARYRRAAALDPAAHVDFRMAVFHSKTGRPDLARAAFDRAERAARPLTPQVRANYELLRGVLDLDRGRLDAALTQFRRADAIFPGHWLIEEHIAEVLTLKGDYAAASRLYEDIVARTGHPEFMDALAAIARERGDKAAAQSWTRRARGAWERRLALFPEAAYGHAIDHYLDAGDTARALDLARRSDQARPHGESKIALARALLKAGRADEARRTIDGVLATRWRTAELHAVAAEVYDALGLFAQAAAQREAEGRWACWGRRDSPARPLNQRALQLPHHPGESQDDDYL
jgi:Tfp pilus assembly protein PilF